MKLTISKSKNAESFYITMSYINSDGKSTSKTIRKLGTLEDLSKELNTDRDGVVAWAKEQVRLETEKYKKDKEEKTVLIPFHADRITPVTNVNIKTKERMFFINCLFFMVLSLLFFIIKTPKTVR